MKLYFQVLIYCIFIAKEVIEDYLRWKLCLSSSGEDGIWYHTNSFTFFSTGFYLSHLQNVSWKNKCMCSLRSSVGKYVQFPSSRWHHFIWLAVLSNPSWLFHLFPYCLVYPERFPRYDHSSYTYMLFMIVIIIKLLIYIF